MSLRACKIFCPDLSVVSIAERMMAKLSAGDVDLN